MSGKDQRLDGGNEHVARFLIQRRSGVFRSILLPVPGNSIVNGMERQAHALLIHARGVRGSLVDNTANIAVEGFSVLPFLVVSPGADVV